MLVLGDDVIAPGSLIGSGCVKDSGPGEGFGFPAGADSASAGGLGALNGGHAALACWGAQSLAALARRRSTLSGAWGV